MLRGIPFTNAYVDPKALYSDEKVVKWLKTPQHTEGRFAKCFGPNIPSNYLDLFEEDMSSLYDKIDTVEQLIFTIDTHIFHIHMYIDKRKKTIMLKEIYIRPCAEKYGFFRIIMYQLARCCNRFVCDLYIETPYAATTAIMNELFEGIIETQKMYIPHCGMGKDLGETRYIILRHEKLKDINLEYTFKLYSPHTTNIKIIPPFDNIAVIFVNKEKFPSSTIMNYGPLAHTNTEEEKDSERYQNVCKIFPFRSD
jgi:hypothetical protein